MYYYSKKMLQEMLLHTFKQIEKSKNPEENMKWFVSEEAREWYKNYCAQQTTDNAKPEDKYIFDAVYEPKGD